MGVNFENTSKPIVIGDIFFFQKWLNILKKNRGNIFPKIKNRNQNTQKLKTTLRGAISFLFSMRGGALLCFSNQNSDGALHHSTKCNPSLRISNPTSLSPSFSLICTAETASGWQWVKPPNWTTMADQKNFVRVTRASKKRAATVTIEEQNATKKRVVLGELHNLSNTVVQAKQRSGLYEPKKKQKYGAKPKAKKVLPMTILVENSTQDEESSDDPHMCGPYISDVFEYLHQLEVMEFIADFFIWVCF